MGTNTATSMGLRLRDSRVVCAPVSCTLMIPTLMIPTCHVPTFPMPSLHALPLPLTLISLILSTAFPSLVSGQNLQRLAETTSNIGSYYYHVQPGETTMQVRLVGAVQAPGLYVLSTESNLGDLIVLSGGPAAGPRARQTRRTIIVRLYRSGNGPTPAYERQFNDTFTQAADYPPLMEGDLVSLEIIERRRFTWRDGFTIINTLALLALTAERLSRIN